MLFNSLSFLVFLPIVFFVYWFVLSKKLRLQNAFLVLASYVFYGWWDWRFLSLIAASSFVDFIIGILLSKISGMVGRKLLLSFSLFFNLGLLIYFKYANFFISSFVSMLSDFGIESNVGALSIILPVGISFYTFQTLSYSIDVYRRKMEPTTDMVVFFAYVSFFPQLVAGPIERAIHLVPQFKLERKFNFVQAKEGMQRILYGFFKKLVIADSLALVINPIYSEVELYSGFTLLYATVLFAFQIYCDFSGYSDIAIGISKLLGFELMENFRTPYFSRDIAEFWRRWHISLTTWFRDYLYIPLGGSRNGKIAVVRNTFIIFIVSGFWHGANWTFIAWGVLNAVLFLPLMILNINRKNTHQISPDGIFPSWQDVVKMLSTFFVVCLTWIFFRADSISEAIIVYRKIFGGFFDGLVEFDLNAFVLVLIFILIEWPLRNMDISEYLKTKGSLQRKVVYVVFILFMFFMASYGGSSFIYFQF